MHKLYKNNKLIFNLYLLFLIVGIFILISMQKGDIYLWINSRHTAFTDQLFYYITSLGNGLTFFILALFFLLFSYRKAMILLLSFLTHIIPVQLFKLIIIPAAQRPASFFHELADAGKLYFIDGVDVHSFHSFPSGHTAGAFAMFFVLISFTKNQWLKLLFLMLAFAIAYSRIYLSQHFFIDIYFGSVFGVASAIFILYFFYSKENYIFSNHAKLNRGIIK